MSTVYILRFLQYKSKDSNFHGIFTTKEEATLVAFDCYPDTEIITTLMLKNKFYDGNGYYVIDEIKINSFYENLNNFLM